MERLFKRHFWAIQAAFLVVSAILLAAAVTAFAASFATPYAIALPATDSTLDIAGAEQDVSRLDLPPYTFGEDEPEPAVDLCAGADCGEGKECDPATGECVDVETVVAEPTPPADGRCIESDIAINLVGTMVSDDDSQWSMAVLHNPSLDRTQFATVGTTLLAEAEVTRVERNRVFILRNGQEECLRYGDQSERAQRRNEQLGGGADDTGRNGADRGAARPTATAATGPSAGSSAGTFEQRLNDGVRRNPDGSYDIDRGLIQEVANNQRLLEQQAPRVNPVYDGGRPAGFQLQGIRSGSMFSQIGIRNGDVLVSVDGTDIDSPQRAAELYDSLIQNNSVEVVVRRRGREQTLRYQMR